MRLGQTIRTRRKELGLTQDQVAARAGISKPYLSNIETGKAKNPPTDGVLRRLERVLQFQAGELTRTAHLVITPVDVREEHELLHAENQKLRAVLKRFLAEGPRTRRGDIDLEALEEKLSGDSNLAALSVGVFVPVINKVAAGYPQSFTDLDYPPSIADDYIRCPDVDDPHAFAARVVGDSMEPDYQEGDFVVFSPAREADSGDDCFVRFAEESGTTFKRVYQDDEETVRLQPLNSKYRSQICSAAEVTGIWPAVYRIQRLKR